MSPFRCSGLLCVLLGLALALPACAQVDVKLATPKTGTVQYGAIRLEAVQISTLSFSHAVFFVDNVGYAIGNALPLSCALDTTQLPNGRHMLQVGLYDEGGAVSYSPPVYIRVQNPAEVLTYQGKPATTPLVPGAEATTVIINGKTYLFDYPAYKKDDRVMVMLRPVSDVAGGSVKWDQRTQTCSITLNGHAFQIAAQQRTILMDGKTVQLDAAVQMLRDRLFVPAIIWQHLTGGPVAEDKEHRAVEMTTPDTMAP